MRVWWRVLGLAMVFGCGDDPAPAPMGTVPGSPAPGTPVIPGAPTNGVAGPTAGVPGSVGVDPGAGVPPTAGVPAMGVPPAVGGVPVNGGMAAAGGVPASPGMDPAAGVPVNGGVMGADPCAGAASGDTHAAAAELLTGMATCGGSSCHGSSNPRATLSLLGVVDLRATLVDRPACEAPALPLIDGSGGAAALARSWLWLKLTAPADAANVLMSDPTWGGPGTCGQPGDQPYGVLMPQGSGGLDEARLKPIRDWICSGAPAPGGG